MPAGFVFSLTVTPICGVTVFCVYGDLLSIDYRQTSQTKPNRLLIIITDNSNTQPDGFGVFNPIDSEKPTR